MPRRPPPDARSSSSSRPARDDDPPSRSLAVELVPARIDDALGRRHGFVVAPATTVRRLIDGEGDDLPGVVVDRYGPVVCVELWAVDWPARLEAFADRLLAEPGVTAVVAVLRTGAGTSEQRVLRGTVPEAQVVVEAGCRYLVRVADERAVGSGIFVDQREGRRLVRAASRGVAVVNLFAHAGAFGVAAAVGGAARVDHVDMAKKTAPWAATNLALNGIDPRGHRFIVDDALQVLAKLARRRGGYGVVVCDPPTQGVRKDGSRFVLRHSLAELAEHGCAALEDGGLLLLSCNDRDVPVAAVLAAA
ncbi:MAG TPA: class I SAM-dependent methyltransferase, partial [Myxococcota bacterium]